MKKFLNITHTESIIIIKIIITPKTVIFELKVKG
jgi:hypothetical protein